MRNSVSIAYSPCPNDTFVFHAWSHGLLPGAPELDVTIADIDVTNDLALHGDLDVLKVSYAALPYFIDRYALLPLGGALGHGCGPLVVSASQVGPESLAGATVAVPSERSTAYLLLRLWAGRAIPGGVGRVVVLPFHEIMPAVRDGAVDAGLIIHEARFTYHLFGLHQVVDLGAAWEGDTGLPIPLGAIVARRDLGTDRLATITAAVAGSVRYAWDHPDASRDYIRAHAQELADDVIAAHIDRYVNGFTAELGETGRVAVHTLLARAAEEGICPPVPASALAYPPASEAPRQAPATLVR